MNPDAGREALPLDIPIPQLVGQVYEQAPVSERSRMLEHLLRPLGVLSLLAVANGIFAKIRFRGGWQDMRIHLEDAQMVQVKDVIALVDWVQQVSVESVDSLAHLIKASPALAGSAAAALLATVLLQRALTRPRSCDD